MENLNKQTRKTPTRNVLRGIVTSNKGEKTITVEVTSYTKHPLYQKRVKRTNKFLAHDEKNEANVGDKVVIMVCRPISKRKAFRLVKIVEKAKELV